ncbi:hypothetical protein HanIR_Chr15g0746671 [Helianthus annuus]|nr:hypothetical protein HanIR_Chr15g0746671 [Helianthus annuus]
MCLYQRCLSPCVSIGNPTNSLANCDSLSIYVCHIHPVILIDMINFTDVFLISVVNYQKNAYTNSSSGRSKETVVYLNQVLKQTLLKLSW